MGGLMARSVLLVVLLALPATVSWSPSTPPTPKWDELVEHCVSSRWGFTCFHPSTPVRPMRAVTRGFARAGRASSQTLLMVASAYLVTEFVQGVRNLNGEIVLASVDANHLATVRPPRPQHQPRVRKGPPRPLKVLRRGWKLLLDEPPNLAAAKVR